MILYPLISKRCISNYSTTKCENGYLILVTVRQYLQYGGSEKKKKNRIAVLTTISNYSTMECKNGYLIILPETQYAETKNLKDRIAVLTTIPKSLIMKCKKWFM